MNDSRYIQVYVSLTIQLHISHLFTQLNDQIGLFLTIQFSISHLFLQSLKIKQFYLTYSHHSFRSYHSGSELTWELRQWKVLRIPQSSSISGASSPDYLAPYHVVETLTHLLVYSIVPGDWAEYMYGKGIGCYWQINDYIGIW